MIAKLLRRQNTLKVLISLFLTLFILSSVDIPSISASDLPDTISPIDVIRQDMHNIAYLYANHWWSAFPGNELFFYPTYNRNDRYGARFNNYDHLLELGGSPKFVDVDKILTR